MPKHRQLDPLSQRYYDKSKEPQKTPEEIRASLIEEHKKKIISRLHQAYDIRSISSWTIKHDNREGYVDIESLEGIYFDVIEYILKKWDEYISPMSKIEISETTKAKSINLDILNRRNSLLKRKDSLEKEIEKIDKELEGL